jgi:hypothetical protein
MPGKQGLFQILSGIGHRSDNILGFPAVLAGPRCRVCGCTNDNACPGGCSWIEPDLCSACAEREFSLR